MNTIRRSDAIDALIKEYPYINPTSITDVIMHVEDADPERPTGRWIHQAKFSRVECDQCGKVFRNTFAPKNFCPNCGSYNGGGA